MASNTIGQVYRRHLYAVIYQNLRKYSGGYQHLQQWKTSTCPSNVALNTNPESVLKFACPEDSKTPPTCYNWLSFDWDIWDQRQMILDTKWTCI